MKCPQCEFENRPQAKFCEECASPLLRVCTNCGTQLSATAKFCPECAHPVTGRAVTQSPFASPQTYTPKHLAEKILTSKSALEGERKQVTVLFADMKGSMELLADRDPEDARKLLDPILEHMMEAVHRYEGTVNQVMGDGIMALFGAPLAHEDHAVRACYAALRMQESVKRYAEGVQTDRRNSDPDSSWRELRGGSRALHRQRSQNGLHRGRPDDPSCCAHGADGDAGIDPDDGRHTTTGRGLRAGESRSGRLM